MDDQQRPIAGWYPDPEDPQRYLRWWDGYAWQLRQPVSSAVTGRVLGKGFQRLGWFVRTGVRLVAMVSVLQVVLYAWGFSMIEDAIFAGDVDKLELFDDLDLVFLLALLATLVPTGICWMVWQYQLAKSADRIELERAPAWHAWGYVVPFVALWFPYGNMVDLVRRRFPGRTRAVIGWWWAFLLTGTISDRISSGLVESADTAGDFRTMLFFAAVSSAAFVAAAPFALTLNRDLSDAERDAEGDAGLPVTPAATPAD